MELELKKESLDTYVSGGELVLTQEETAETIVPDYCPDIARIIHTSAAAYLRSQEVREGRAELSGTIQVTVLYTPDGESGVRALEVAMPFTVESDGRAFPDCQLLLAETEAEAPESRTLNPRKILTRCKLVSRISGYRSAPLTVCSDVSGDACVEKRRETQRAILLTQIAEKEFTFTDTLRLSQGRPGAAELLGSRVTPCVTESRIIGNKLLLKGVFTLSVLYRTAEGGCCAAGGELPFSQILEVEGAPEDAQISLRLRLTGTDIQVDEDDPEGRQLGVTLYLHATALLRQERELTMLTDLYSTACDMRCEVSPLSTISFLETTTRRQTIREILEIGVSADSILSLSADCGQVFISREEGTTVLRTAITVRALYLDEGGVPLSVERTVDGSCRLELPEHCAVRGEAVCPEEVQGSLSPRGIEVRFPVEFQVEAAQETSRMCVTAASLDPDSPKDTAAAPSLVLRRMGRGETAWDLAKRHNTTVADILSANHLEDESALAGERLILIPKKRI